MIRFITIATATAVLVQPAVLHAEAPTVQLVKTGDAQMSCDALASEINQLAAAEAKPKKKRFGLGGIGKVLMAASPLGALAGNGVAGQLMGQAAGMVEQGAADARMTAQLDAANAGAQSIEGQRKTRLLTLFAGKGC